METEMENRVVQNNASYLQPGTVLANKYRINHVIGQGGFGITYDGTDLKLNMHIAIKEYFPTLMASRQTSNSTCVICTSGSVGLYEHGLKNFIDEARNMAKFAGEENFVAVHDYFTENNTAYIVMEFVEGVNLKQYLQQKGRLSMAETIAIITPVMQVLETIHSKGMIHRDVSPSNIMILYNGRVRLLDFGAAKDISLETGQLTTMSSVYKFGYSPIEQLTHGLKQGPFTDIYALCATIYEMLTSAIPPSPFQRSYEGAQIVPPSQFGVQITPIQEAALIKGLAINGEDRIQTIAELRDALCGTAAQFDNGSYYAPYGSYKAGQNGASGTDNRLLKVILGVAVAALVVSLGLGLYFVRGGRGSSKDNTPAQAAAEAEAGAQLQETETVEALGGESVSAQNTDANSPDVSSEVQDQNTEEEAHFATGEGFGGAISHGGESSNDSGDSGGSEEQSSIPEDALVHGGHSYYLFDNGMHSFDEAQQYCESRGGYLAVINNSGENEALYQYMRDCGYRYAHFGYTDRDREGTWHWVSNDSSSFEDWGVNEKGEQEPNADTEKEDYAVFCADLTDGHWNDSQYGWNSYAYLCEWDTTR